MGCRKSKNSRKTSTSVLLIMSKLLTVWITTNCGQLFKRWEYQTTWPASWEICMRVRKQQLEPKHGTTDWFQTGKGVRQGCILSPCLFNLHPEFSSVTQSCLTLCDSMDCGTPSLPVHCQLLEFTQTHVHWAEYIMENAGLDEAQAEINTVRRNVKKICKWHHTYSRKQRRTKESLF